MFPKSLLPYDTIILQWVNSLAPGIFEQNVRWIIFKLILVIDSWCVSCEIALRWISLDLTDDKSTLVQVMAWCRQATSHYLSQCWPRFMSPYDVTGPQGVNKPTSWIGWDVTVPKISGQYLQSTACSIFWPWAFYKGYLYGVNNRDRSGISSDWIHINLRMPYHIQDGLLPWICCGSVTPYGNNDSTKPLPEPMLIFRSKAKLN